MAGKRATDQSAAPSSTPRFLQRYERLVGAAGISDRQHHGTDRVWSGRGATSRQNPVAPGGLRSFIETTPGPVLALEKRFADSGWRN